MGLLQSTAYDAVDNVFSFLRATVDDLYKLDGDAMIPSCFKKYDNLVNFIHRRFFGFNWSNMKI